MANGHGGARPGSGRKPGAATKKIREAADRLASEGLTPLDYMVGVLRGEMEFDPVKFQAAEKAAPYMHPRLASIDATVKTPDLKNASDDELLAIARGGAVAGTAGRETELH